MKKSSPARRFGLLSPLVAALALVGCIKIGSSSSGGKDECNEDTDCETGEVCDDGECKSGGSSGGTSGASAGGTSAGGTSAGGTSAGGTSGSVTGGTSSGGSGTAGSAGTCGSICDWSVSCGLSTRASCLSSCESELATGASCRAAYDRVAACLRANSTDCSATEGVCGTLTDTAAAACGGATCDYTEDLECDEPEGTGLCPEGTDVSDCICPFTNDGQCDEPNLCPAGSDALDCICPFTNDGECDEPEGTDLCAEGTDPYDCAGV